MAVTVYIGSGNTDAAVIGAIGLATCHIGPESPTTSIIGRIRNTAVRLRQISVAEAQGFDWLWGDDTGVVWGDDTPVEVG